MKKPGGNGDGPLVLVVDDDDSIREMLETALKPRGFRVSVAANGVEALEAVQAELPRLIVLDYFMPVMDGAQFMRELRKLVARRPPVILFTAVNVPASIPSDIGVDVCVNKPVDIKRFLRLCEAVIRANIEPRPRRTDAAGRERRVHERLPFHQNVLVRLTGTQRMMPAETLDVSEGGMGLVSSQPPQPWAYVAVSLELEDESVELDGRVRHSQPDGRFGIQFLALDNGRRHTVLQLLGRVREKKQ